MPRIKLVVNGREVEAILCTYIKRKLKKRIHKGREYKWYEYRVEASIPKEWANRKLVILPLPEQ